MPTNKNAQLRYQIIDKCLSNWSRRYYIEDLVDACNEALYLYNGETKDGCGVKKRQVQEDLKFIVNPAKRKAMAVKNEKRFLKQKRNALKNPGYSRHPVKTQASFKRLLKAV